MNSSRIIGNNVNLELKAQSLDLTEFGKRVGFSLADVRKLIEGRLFLPPLQLKKIADALGITRDQLIEDRGMSEYNSLIHNFREFKNESNQGLVLDLIDMYADLAEIL